MPLKIFKPAIGLSHRHLQSILSSSGPRKILEKRRAKILLNTAKQHIITTPQGVKLLGYLSKSQQSSPAKGVAIIVHGWEGSANSLYVLSSGQALLNEGFDVFRLNLRDHGDSHSLNRDLFNSARLQEVVEAVKYVCATHGGGHNVLCGYSLGGNFCLRVANVAQEQGVNLDQVVAICPLLDPGTTMKKLNRGFFVYEKYFVKKWKKSLFKKLLHHQHFNYDNKLKTLSTLDQMNDFFIIGYTDFDSTNAYFDAYSILGDRLNKIAIPTTIIAAADDPMIPVSQLNSVFHSPWLTIDVQAQGGHCAFIKNWKFESWVSDRIVAYVKEAVVN